MDERDPGQTRRLGSLGGAKPKRPRYGLPILRTPGQRGPPPRAGTQPGKSVTHRLSFNIPTYPGAGRQPPGAGTQPATYRFTYELPSWIRTQLWVDRLRDNLPDMPNSVPGYDKLPPRADVYDIDRSPEAELDTCGTPTVGG